jgi:hypothetical protein
MSKDRYHLIRKSSPQPCTPDRWVIYDSQKDQILLITQSKEVAAMSIKRLLGSS